MPLITGIHTIEGGRAGRPAAGDRGGTDRLVLLDNGRRLRVDVEQVVLHGLAPGGEIEPSLVARLAAQEA